MPGSCALNLECAKEETMPHGLEPCDVLVGICVQLTPPPLIICLMIIKIHSWRLRSGTIGRFQNEILTEIMQRMDTWDIVCIQELRMQEGRVQEILHRVLPDNHWVMDLDQTGGVGSLIILGPRWRVVEQGSRGFMSAGAHGPRGQSAVPTPNSLSGLHI